MRTSRTRRLAVRTGLLAASAVTAVAGLGATAAVAADTGTTAAARHLAAPDTASHNSLLGVWKVKGIANGNPVEPTYTFKADGTFVMIPEDNAYVGSGTWKQQRDGSFTFHLEHYIYVDGKPVSQIKAEQAGKVTGDTFTSSGVSGRYDLSGNLLETFSVTISGTRVTK
ncbi:hypothetical protein ACFY1P_14575 [Streptomyces sp. NPDC001407]|uniref:hypothetical protein n=1 Tax=unclassified Streptomyces TaxID=2593676 RepID=UPI0034057A51